MTISAPPMPDPDDTFNYVIKGLQFTWPWPPGTDLTQMRLPGSWTQEPTRYPATSASAWSGDGVTMFCPCRGTGFSWLPPSGQVSG